MKKKKKESMEERWLRSPEREKETFHDDPTRSPYEGDIPPWGQAGYEGYFPLAGKVFYLTAYLGDKPVSIRDTQQPITAKATLVKNIGKMEPGTQFGSEFMFQPIAAIPIRHEDLRDLGPLVNYLSKLISGMNLFGRILIEPSFPNADIIELSQGRWFPVSHGIKPWGGLEFVNAYSMNRFYGGPEEGGWWYDSGSPIASVPIEQDSHDARVKWEEYLQNVAGWYSEYDTGSVLGHDVFETRLEDTFAAPFPTEKPYYS